MLNPKTLITLLAILLPTSLHALSPEIRLSDEAQEQRAMNLFLQVRCLVCAGQVIESSNTEFSSEMRKLIRKKISDGKNDEKIKAELVTEFGEDILSEPRIGVVGWVFLWCLPLVFTITAISLMVKMRMSSCLRKKTTIP